MVLNSIPYSQVQGVKTEHNYYRTNCITKLSESQINNYRRVHYTNLREISEIVAIVTNIYN